MTCIQTQKERVFSLIEQSRGELAQLTSQLVKFPSLFTREEEIQRYLAQRLRDMGADALDVWYPDMEEMRKHPAYCSARTDFSTSPVVVGTFRGTGGGRSLILNGHVDVVPEGDGWDASPWSGEITQDRVWGRGSGDMKAGIAANLVALEAIRRAGIRLKGDVLLETVVDEENGGMGSLATIVRGYRADGVLIPECTGMNVVNTTIGSTWVRITVHGKAAILANANEGVSAIQKCMYLCAKLEELEQERTGRLAHPMLSRFPTPFKINVGKLNAGIWPSSVPDLAVMEIRYGMSPMETVEQAKQEFEEFLARVCGEDPWLCENRPELEWLGTCWQPMSVDEDNELIQLTKANTQFVRKQAVQVTGMAYAADGALYTRYLGIPFVLIGPGGLQEAHQVNEFVSISDTVDTCKIIAATVLDWCGCEPADGA